MLSQGEKVVADRTKHPASSSGLYTQPQSICTGIIQHTRTHTHNLKTWAIYFEKMGFDHFPEEAGKQEERVLFASLLTGTLLTGHGPIVD